jgi:membrane-associated protein
MSWLQDPAALVAHWPLMALPFLVGFAAFAKYVVPPFPGDSLMLLGFFLSAHGGAPSWTIVLGACCGGLLGAACAFYLGRRLGMPLLARIEERSSKVPVEKLRRLFATFGEKSLLLNRFLPILRSFMLYAAGASGLRAGPSIFWSAWSNLFFALLLSLIGHNVSASWPEIVALFQTVGRSAGIAALTLLLLGLAARALWRRRTEQRTS